MSTALSTLFVVAGVEAATAQDFVWTGFYAGAGFAAGSGGGGQGDAQYDPGSPEWPYGPVNLLFNTSPVSGAAFSADVGFNVEMDNFLYGIELGVLGGHFVSEGSNSATEVVSWETTAYVPSFVPTDTLSFYSTLYSTFAHTITGNGTDTVTNSTEWNDTTSYYEETTVGPDGKTTYYAAPTSHSSGELLTSTEEIGEYTTDAVVGSTTTVAVATISGRTSVDWLTSIKGRAGFTQDRTLFFASAGVAIGQVTQVANGSFYNPDPNPGGPYSGSTNNAPETSLMVGPIIGVGVEQAVTDNMMFRAEIDYFNLGTATYQITGPPLTVTYSEMVDGFIGKAGIEFKF